MTAIFGRQRAAARQPGRGAQLEQPHADSRRRARVAGPLRGLDQTPDLTQVLVTTRP
jgi:hypothetical protein